MTAPTPAIMAAKLTAPATAGPKAIPPTEEAELGVVEAEEPELAADPPDDFADPVDLAEEPDMEPDMDPDMLDMEPVADAADPEAPETVAMEPSTPREERAIPFPTEE
jgi:hypothetical protein